MSACLHCKRLKVKCTEAETGCERCLKAGRPCLPAPPSRQGKRTREPKPSENELSALQAKQEGASDVAQAAPRERIPEPITRLISQIVNDWGPSNSCSFLLLGFFSGGMPPPVELLWLLRHWASIASLGNSHALLHSTLNLAAACNIPVAEVLKGIDTSTRPTGLPRALPADKTPP